MARCADLSSVLIIGAGPIVIGQACEFDYSGTQACKALKEEGLRVILINSNPATIMTDPEIADATYIEPVRWQTVAEVIRQECPDAILPTMGGQTALNCVRSLCQEGVLEEYQVRLIGASMAAINKAEDRQLFKDAMRAIGLPTPQSRVVRGVEEARVVQEEIGYPIIVRPSFTLGGSGGGIAYDDSDFMEICVHGLRSSPTSEVLLEKSLLGWKEFEMEVVRDREDNCIVVCSIENLDPMGVHTGDSITVAPAQTLTDKEYQVMRNASIAVLREIGVETGGSNVQFAINPDNGEMVVIEMNPRVSRSSALASKATGFPIARIATKLALGYTLYELRNEITGDVIPASFEPTIDYIVTKIPRFTFEKFPQADSRLTTQMKSVGEVMAIGGTFQESLQKALRGLEVGLHGLDELDIAADDDLLQLLRNGMRVPEGDRLLYIAHALRCGMSRDEVFECCLVDPWFLAQIEDLVLEEQRLKRKQLNQLDRDLLHRLKRKGFSDGRLAVLLGTSEKTVRDYRWQCDVRPVFKRVDSCAAEFATTTAYMYSTYADECEALPEKRRKVMVLGGGPNRIGQGIEFDYCCVQAVLAMREAGYETIMVNCNPETVSTDYDVADRLYFEPLTIEDVLEIVALEQPDGVILQYGGQTPLRLARSLDEAGVPILGTSTDSIDLAEDRERFQQLLIGLGLNQPVNRIAHSTEQAVSLALEVGYPLIARPSYVLGGRAMEIVYNAKELARYMDRTIAALGKPMVLLDSFLENAIEVDVDAICDGREVLVGGIMQHIEQAGIHSGDSACCLPPYSLSDEVLAVIKDQVGRMAMGLNVVGLMNVQFAIQDDDVYVLEVNPRASRTVPFVSKVTGVPLARIAARCMIGETLAQQELTGSRQSGYFAVKESVFPFIKLPGVDPVLGPEMQSTGEVMGVGKSFGEAFAKAQLAAGEEPPDSGLVFISVRDKDKDGAVVIATRLVEMGFRLCATHGTAKTIREAGLDCEGVNKMREGQPHIVDLLKDKQVDMIVNTTEGKQAIADSYSIRRTALQYQVFYTTTIEGAMATILALQQSNLNEAVCLQDWYQGGKGEFVNG